MLSADFGTWWVILWKKERRSIDDLVFPVYDESFDGIDSERWSRPPRSGASLHTLEPLSCLELV